MYALVYVNYVHCMYTQLAHSNVGRLVEQRLCVRQNEIAYRLVVQVLSDGAEYVDGRLLTFTTTAFYNCDNNSFVIPLLM